MRISKKFIVSTTVALMFIVSMGTAMAQYPVVDEREIQATGQAATGISTAVGQTTTAVGALQAETANDLRLLSGAQTTTNKELLQALQAIASTQDTRNVVGDYEKATYDAANQATSGTSGCNMATGAMGAQGLENLAAQYREQSQQAQLDWYLGNSPNSPSHNGPEAAAVALESTYCASQSTQADIQSGFCTGKPTLNPSEPQPGGAGTTASNTPDALNADILINPTNGVLSPAQATAANVFMAFVSPDPVGPLPDNSANTASGRNEAEERMKNAALASVASATWANLAGVETPNNPALAVTPDQVSNVSSSSPSGTVNAAQTLASWAEATAAETTGYTPTSVNGKPVYFPNGVSYDAYLELRAKSWANNLNFLAGVNSESEEADVKDLVTIAAFQAQQGWEDYHMLENQNALLASILDTLKSEHQSN